MLILQILVKIVNKTAYWYSTEMYFDQFHGHILPIYIHLSFDICMISRHKDPEGQHKWGVLKTFLIWAKQGTSINACLVCGNLSEINKNDKNDRKMRTSETKWNGLIIYYKYTWLFIFLFSYFRIIEIQVKICSFSAYFPAAWCFQFQNCFLCNVLNKPIVLKFFYLYAKL